MEQSRVYRSNPYLIALLAIGALDAVFWVILYVANDKDRIWFLEINDTKLWFLDLLFLVIILLSPQLVHNDASIMNAGEAYPQQKTFRAMTWSPASWGVLVFFLWIFVLPLYIYKREEIYWQNISADYSTLGAMKREIKTQTVKKAAPPPEDKSEYSENVGFCSNCDTPYPLRMLERSKFCNRCGELLVKNEE
jgi:hypothetical protein